jgi:hypothetical protein
MEGDLVDDGLNDVAIVELEKQDAILNMLNEIEGVATPLLEECEDETHILEMRTWESTGTPKTFKVRLQGSKHLALGCSLYLCKFIEA